MGIINYYIYKWIVITKKYNQYTLFRKSVNIVVLGLLLNNVCQDQSSISKLI